MNKIVAVLFVVSSVALSASAEEKLSERSGATNEVSDIFDIRRPGHGYTTNVSYPDSKLLSKVSSKPNDFVAKFVLSCFEDGNYYSETYGEGNQRSGRDVYQFPRMWKWGRVQYRDGISLNIVVDYPLCNGRSMSSDGWSGTITAKWSFKYTPFDLLVSIF